VAAERNRLIGISLSCYFIFFSQIISALIFLES
jgi:hypothetical protein